MWREQEGRTEIRTGGPLTEGGGRLWGKGGKGIQKLKKTLFVFLSGWIVRRWYSPLGGSWQLIQKEEERGKIGGNFAETLRILLKRGEEGEGVRGLAWQNYQEGPNLMENFPEKEREENRL